ILRLLIDSGMLSNFPGGMRASQTRILTNDLAPGPGEFVPVDLQGMDDIRKCFITMPYKGPDQVLMQLYEAIRRDGQRIAGIMEVDVGEGRTNVPVGTMISQLEQAMQLISYTHKQLHTAQALELELLRECFEEHPECLVQLNPDPAYKTRTAAELASYELVPASDPNVPAQVHRIMQATALNALATNPATGPLYDQMAVQKRILRTLAIDDADELLKPPPPPGAPPPDPKAMALFQKNQI